MKLFKKKETEEEKAAREAEAWQMMIESERVIAANPGLFGRSNTVVGEIAEFSEWQKRQKKD